VRFLGALFEWRGRARPPASPWTLGLGTLLVAVVVGALCWPSRAADFEADDFGYMHLLHDRPLGHFLRLGDISEGMWGHRQDELRPVMAFSYKLGSLLHGVAPARLHLSNIALHVLVTLGVVALVLALAPAARHAALLAGLLFGLAPAHAEAICWITGKVESLAALFYLGSFVLFLRFRRAGRWPLYLGAVCLYGLGVFTKEILITLPALLLACDLLLLLGLERWRRLRARARLRWLAAHLPFIALAATLMIARALIFGSAVRAERLGLRRGLAFLGVQGDKLLQLLAPFPELSSLPSAPSAFTLLASATLLGGLLALLVWLWRARTDHAATLKLVAFLGLVWYGLNMAPLIVTYVSARHLYLPSCGLLAALALLVFPVTAEGLTRVSPARWALAALLVLVNGVLLIGSEHEWISAGRRSAAIRSGMQRAAAELPAGSIVVLAGVPSESERLMLWSRALPFALQPPFTAADVYGRLRVLEPPALYYRPVSDWWQAHRGVLLGLVSGDPQTELDLYLAQWNVQRGELVLRHARPTRGWLQRQSAGATRQPLESVEVLSDQEAERLMRRLTAATRQAAVHLAGEEAVADLAAP
jgi:hypothetical protein